MLRYGLRPGGARHGGAPAPAALAVLLVAVLALPGCASAPVGGGEVRGHVARVGDGDTIVVRTGRREVRVRLHGVDAPEHGQPWSGRARRFTAELAGDRDVVLRVWDTDRYGRLVADVLLPDGRDLGDELLRAGLAWHYRWYSDDPRRERLEAEARAARRGLWREGHPVEPRAFRERERRTGRAPHGGRRRPRGEGAARVDP